MRVSERNCMGIQTEMHVNCKRLNKKKLVLNEFSALNVELHISSGCSILWRSFYIQLQMFLNLSQFSNWRLEIGILHYFNFCFYSMFFIVHLFIWVKILMTVPNPCRSKWIIKISYQKFTLKFTLDFMYWYSHY